MDRRRRKRKHRHRSQPHKRQSLVSKKGEAKQKSDMGLFPFLLLLGFVFVGIYIFYDKKSNAPNNDELPVQPETDFTVNERIQMKKADIQMEQDIQLQRTLSEKLKKPVEKIDQLEPEVSALDMGARFPDNASMKAVFEDLNEKPFKNDIYEDPEDIIRQQIAHQEWLEKYLKERNEQEREEFIRRFVQIAEAQGYRVHFGEDMKVFLEPVDPDEEKAKKDKFDEVKINWK